MRVILIAQIYSPMFDRLETQGSKNGTDQVNLDCERGEEKELYVHVIYTCTYNLTWSQN